MQSEGVMTNELLGALDRLMVQAADRAKAARAGIEKNTFAPYYAYRAAIAEYQALVSVIEARLNGLSPQLVHRARDRLIGSRRRVLRISIRSAFEFFFSLSTTPGLPLGVRDVFAEELRHLSTTRDELRSPDHQGKLPTELEQDLRTAETILQEVMDKAPTLVSFDASE
jgi:hypothetical protein